MLYHALTSPVADVTGTVTVYNSAGVTTTAAATDIVRPSDWNSAHVQVQNFAGNTAGTSQISGTNLYFAGGNNITLSANGQTVSIVGGLGGGGGVALSAGTNSTSTGTVVFSNASGVSFGMETNGVVTASVKTDYLTTAQPVGAYLTTAALSNHSHNFATTTTTGSQIVVGTTNSNGVTIGVPEFLTTAQAPGAYLTTAAQSNHSHALATTTTNGSQIVIATTNSAGATMAVPPFITTYVNDLTSGRAGTGFTSTTTAGTAVVGTLSTNGLSMGVPAFLTTAAATNVTTNNMATSERNNYFYTSNNTFANSTHSHGNPTLALTNISGTTASASNGLTLSLSAAGGGVINQTGPNIAAGTQTATSGTVIFSNANGVTFGLSDQTVTASVNAGGAAPAAYWAVPPWGAVSALITNVTAIDKRAFFVPFQNVGNLSVQEIMFPMSRSTSGSNAFTIQYGIYSYANSTALSLISSEQDVYSHTATASQSGIRLFEAIFDNTFTIGPGQYAVGLWFSANGGNTASMNYSLIGGTTANPYVGIIHPGTDQYFTHTTHGAIQMFGRHSVTSGSLPTSMAQSNLFGAYTGSNQPIPLAFTIGTHN